MGSSEPEAISATGAAGALESGETQVFGHFLLIQELGRGAQGVVHLAHDRQLNRKVALKMLTGLGSQSPASRARFRREAEIASRLDHPGICGVHEVGEEGGVPFISMQYVRGTTLADLIGEARARRDGSAPEDEPTASSSSLGDAASMPDVLRIVERTARALHSAHEAGLLHRDIKPANVMITPDGHPVILDFGLARDLEDHGRTLTETGAILGTPSYLAPEQIQGDRGKIDRRTDVYALGVALYECLTLERPFQAKSFDQLFHQILQGTPKNPRSLNPRIPRELGIVIEVAMERDRERRYASALDLAEDLRAIRAFEPIRAHAPGPLTRLSKWSQRKPAQAVASAAAALFVLTAALVFGVQAWRTKIAVRDHLARAESLHAQGDFDGALEAVAQAREREPESTAALELKVRLEREREAVAQAELRKADLEAARQAREEAAGEETRHAELRARIAALSGELEVERAAAFAAFASDQARGTYARKQRELQELQLEAERLLQAAHEALELAARREAPWGRTAETDDAFLRFYLARWREALDSKDAVRAALYRSALERGDTQGVYRDELLGRGTLEVAVVPADAEISLFRYEPYETIHAGDPVPRLVPVPTAGVGRVRPGAWTEGFHPGDVCLAIDAVEPGSPAAEAGLSPGDLVIGCQGEPADGGVWLFEARESALGGRALVFPARIATLGGAQIENLLDWTFTPYAPVQGGEPVTLRASGETLSVSRASARVAELVELVERGGEGVELELACLRRGEPLLVHVPRGIASGLRCTLDAYPLVLAAENRIEAGAAREIDPGSYLLDVRRAGFEPQRVPLRVERHGEVRLEVELNPEGASPPGFVWVPPGPFRSGGDREAREPRPEREVELPGFLIARHELTTAEWQEFQDDPETRARIEASPPGTLYVPREMVSGVIPKEALGGPTTPLMGISWEDVRDYLAWRNARAERDGERWTYALPTEEQWEKAARGVDGRAFPWGERFDFANTIGFHHAPGQLYLLPVGSEPRDASPYGVLDLAGSRAEWMDDPHVPTPDAPLFYRVRGGSWLQANEIEFRSASRNFGRANFVAGSHGLRLVAVPRE